MADSDILYFPRGSGFYTTADGVEHQFAMQAINIGRPHGTVGFGGYIRTLRDRMADHNPHQSRRLTNIEEVSRIMPQIATWVRKHVRRSAENADTWASFKDRPVTVKITTVRPDNIHIDVEYRIEAEGDVVVVRQRDPMR